MNKRFKPIGNMGCRTWWGGGDLRDRDLGVWPGEWLMGVNGPREGNYDKKFVKCCVKHRLLYVRTVELFWAFEYHRKGFPSRLDVRVIRQMWRAEKVERRRAALGIMTTEPEWWKPRERGMTLIRMPKVAPKRMPQLNQEARAYLDDCYPEPAPWKTYLRWKKKYFLTELARYRQVIKFWRECDDSVRQAFHRCARFSNRRPESHPDYFVVFRDSHGRVSDFGFVEVKGPRESLRPSQRRFFPELVRRAGQKVWLARFKMRGNGISFGQFTGTGQFILCDSVLESFS